MTHCWSMRYGHKDSLLHHGQSIWGQQAEAKMKDVYEDGKMLQMLLSEHAHYKCCDNVKSKVVILPIFSRYHRK